MVAPMEEVFVTLRHMQQENRALRDSIIQNVQASMSLGCAPTTSSQVKEA
jgi:hypothetical protein